MTSGHRIRVRLRRDGVTVRMVCRCGWTLTAPDMPDEDTPSWSSVAVRHLLHTKQSRRLAYR